VISFHQQLWQRGYVASGPVFRPLGL